MRTTGRGLLGLLWLLTCTGPIAAQQLAPSAPSAAGDYSREAYVIEKYRTAWRFENDGTGRREISVRIKIQNETGVQQWGQLVFAYSAASERMDVGPVRVHKADGTIVTATAAAVQDLTSAVERIAPVYTDLREKHVTVPGLRPDDTLEYSVVTTIHTPIAPGQFWTEYEFIKAGIVLDEELQIDVPREKTITLRTRPGFNATTSERDGRRIYQWRSARLTKDDDTRETAQSRTSRTPEPAAVRLTTFPTWDAIGRWYSELERTQKTPSPEIRKKAAELTAGRRTDLEKLQALYEYVATNVRYVSLSFGVGWYQPHAAADVLRNQYGDCKDKHTLLASLAESIGLRASTALVNALADVDPDFPSPSQFNHVITRVSTAGGDAWLDSTPEVAPFRLLSPNLRGKHALVVEPEGRGQLLDTPADAPMSHSMTTHIDATLSESGSLSTRVRTEMSGDPELMMRMVFRRTPRDQWKKLLEGMANRDHFNYQIGDWKVTDAAAIREPFTIEYQAQTAIVATSASRQLELTLPLSDLLSVVSEAGEERSDIKLGPPRTAEYTLRLELPPTYASHAPLGVAVNRDYGEYRASYAVDGGIFRAGRTLFIRRADLPADRRGDYAAFRRVVSGDLDQALKLERMSAAPATAPEQLKAEQLYSNGADALEEGSYRQAVSLLKRVTELEPAHNLAWNQLGRAYLRLDQVDEAIGAFRQQIEINAYDMYAYKNLGLAYFEQRRFTEAESAFQKQLEINPLDSSAHWSLGAMYLDRRKYEAALPELEKAVVLTPKTATLHALLGRAYLNLGQHDRAMKAFARAVELDASPAVWNLVAYHLALNKTELDLGQSYAESAVASIAAKSRNISLDRVTAGDTSDMNELGAYWDTLGWIHFARGDLVRAEPFLKASWQILQNPDVGDHLGQLYEKQGKRNDAVRMYALAMHGEGPDETTKDRLVALVGSAQRAESEISKYRDAFVRERTIVINRSGPAGATADYYVLFGRDSIETVKFISGDDRLRSWVDTLRTVKYRALFPDETPAKVFRRGTLSCSSAGQRPSCQFVLLSLKAAQLAQVQ
jgi:tetratricopeptide (TPR) repeat protein/transglutaminase-like putative cysteine protease